MDIDRAGRCSGMNHNLRIGMIGAGGVARRHVETLGTFPDVDVVVVHDPDTERARTLARTADCGTAESIEALLDRELDAAYVCVPPFAHGEVERRCLERDLPFFVEKPVAAELAVAEEIGAGVDERGLLTATGYHWRYSDATEAARQALRGRVVRLMSGAWWDRVPPPAWWARQELSGGQVVEQLTHLLDLARVLMGEVIEVQALGERVVNPRRPDADIDDMTVAVLRWDTGALGTLSATSRLPSKQRAGLELVTDEGVLEVSEGEFVSHGPTGVSRVQSISDPRISVDRSFCDALLGTGDDIRAPYAEALRTHRLACAITRSAHTGRPIRLPMDQP